MKKIIRFIAVALAVTLILCSVPFSSSAEEPDTSELLIGALSSEEPLTEEQPAEEPPAEEPTVPGLPPMASDESCVIAEDTVALLFLCSNSSGLPSLGHIWIYIENITENTLKVGAYDLNAYEGVSIGTFGLTRSDGFGIYYNIESYTGNAFGMEKSMCLMTELNQKEFNRVSSKIGRSNFWDPIFFNCAFFAISTWDIGGGSFMIPFVVFPIFARLQIRFRPYKKDLKMYFPELERVLKQKGTGSGARLKNVKPGSVDTPPG